eukprot:CAMPEP_0204574042 /NCGR_PEP_ID=MMETSP0661-20131031/40370_1 /ASSEMBLY_ACC=CAM_ASM_000606 /TAXON_ID=109239 /ORGANISM="Alexandrium margalefi, Strain AMGDE01CS-322" /LENGTH=528 /DNA_ID=CAMNT_0051582529 /DNA_START=82 /DNA_END=1668 /DNA_ORIENTATION=+
MCGMQCIYNACGCVHDFCQRLCETVCALGCVLMLGYLALLVFVNAYLAVVSPHRLCPYCDQLTVDNGTAGLCSWPDARVVAGCWVDCPAGYDAPPFVQCNSSDACASPPFALCDNASCKNVTYADRLQCVPHCHGAPTRAPGTEWRDDCNTVLGSNCTTFCSDGWHGADVVHECRMDSSGDVARWQPRSEHQCEGISVCTQHGKFLHEEAPDHKPSYRVSSVQSTLSSDDAGAGHPAAGGGGGRAGAILVLFSFALSSTASQPYFLSQSSADSKPGRNVTCPDERRPQTELLEAPEGTLCPMTGSLVHGKEGLVSMLERWSRRGGLLHGMAYAVQSINITRATAGTPFAAAGPMGDALGSLAVPLQHHFVAFGLDPSVLRDCPRAHTRPPYLIVHLVTQGVIWEVAPMHRDLVRAWEMDGVYKPEWVSDFLQEGAHTTYGFFTSNCQHFASDLVRHVYRRCRDEREVGCREADLTRELPLTVYQCWPVVLMSLAVGAALAGLAVAKCCRRLKRRVEPLGDGALEETFL